MRIGCISWSEVIMYLRSIVTAISLLIFPILCLPAFSGEPVALDDFIAGQGMDTSEFGYTLEDFQTVPSDPFTIPRMMTLLNDPMLIPEYTKSGGEYYLEHKDKIGELLRKCARDSGFYLWREHPPLKEEEGKDAWELFTPPYVVEDWKPEIERFIQFFPDEKKVYWIRFFAACTQFDEARKEALRNIPENNWALIHRNSLEFLLTDEFYPEVYDACINFDFASFYRGAMVLCDALDELRANVTVDEMRDSFPGGLYRTPLGMIAVTRDRSHNLTASAYESVFFIIDIGGDDKYSGLCWNESIDEPIRIIWDLGGNDTHSCKSWYHGQAAGCLGIAILIDEGGDDTYNAKDFAQGAGIFGVGILYDVSGNDKYYMNQVGQGAGVFGLGILADLAGDDEYSCLFGGQGFAYVRGGGLLLDVAGNDEYVARDDEIVNPSAQTKEHNVSMAQGAGYGRRADFSDGHFMSGGVGFLVDGGGDDNYSAGVFAQAVGYWFGGGFIYEAGGDDRYNGVWYAQAASAHFAPAGLIDVAGDDVYFTLISQCLGNGRDLSNAVFIDLDGDDKYTVPDRSGGCGNINGFGLFVDLRGDDTYEILKPITMGRGDLAEVQGNLVREKMDSTGVFIDAGGDDGYSYEIELPFIPGNNSVWGIATKPGEMSLGIDGEFDLLLWPVK